MSQNRIPNLNIEGARLMFRNFSGKETRFNMEGNRNFNVVIEDPERAEELKQEGWNVRVLPARDQEDSETYILPVKVAFNQYPPKIVLVSNGGRTKTELTEDGVNVLDWAQIVNCDMTLNPYNYSVNGRQGVKAYLKTLYVTVEEDKWEEKYADDNPPSCAECAAGEECDANCDNPAPMIR